ncbi:MAG: hypothetical protein KDD41_03635 [Flavobacteriales bacterium]|nr:hypothetical protein [Flavobacteriales bacterium]
MKTPHQNSNQVFFNNNSVEKHLFLQSNADFRNHSIKNPLSILEEVIEGLNRNYRELEEKEGKYIDYRLKKNKKLINDLYTARDSLSFLKWYDVWVLLEASMDHLLKKDPELSGFQFRVRTKMNGENFASLMWD